MRRHNISPQARVVWDHFKVQLTSVGQSAPNTQSTLYSQSRPNSTDLSYLFENAKFDICRNLNDSASLSLDLKRIQCINNNNDKLAIPDLQSNECSPDSLSSSLASKHKSANTTQHGSLTFDVGDNYPTCSTPHGTQIRPGGIEAFFDDTRENKKPKKLNFDDSFSLVINESFLLQLDVVEGKETPPCESGETSSSESDLLVTMDKNKELAEPSYDNSLFGESFWMTAGQAAEVD